MKLSVIGGDKRQIMLSEALKAERLEVGTFALGLPSDAPSLEAAVGNAVCVILPLPCESADGILNTPLSEKSIRIDDIFVSGRDAVVCAGKVSDKLVSLSEKHCVRLADYSAREDFATANARLTAEAALGIILRELPRSVNGLEALVIGCGRIGRLMAQLLRAVNADVTVSARRDEHFALIRAEGFKAADTRFLEAVLPRFDLIVNTAPSEVLGEGRLRLLKGGCLIIDLASKPGGTDFRAAEKLGVKALHELGLPGRCLPVGAGIVIKDTILSILKEWGIE